MTNQASGQPSLSFPARHAWDPVHPLMGTTTATFAFGVALSPPANGPLSILQLVFLGPGRCPKGKGAEWGAPSL